MKIKLAIALSFISASVCPPLFAEQFNSAGLPGATSSHDAQAPDIQRIGAVDRFSHWHRENARDDEQSKSNLSFKGSDAESRRMRPNRPLIRPSASPKQAAALRFAEKGRRLLLGGAYQRALIYFEKALGLDANPYFYYYLARAHYHLAHTQESLRFLEVAETLLTDQSDWIAEVETLRAKFNAPPQKAGRNVRPVALPIR